jgi:hypothetical protein
MEINLQDLKDLIKKAIEDGERLREAKMIDDSKAEKLRHETAKLWADGVAVTIPILCKKAAMGGKSKVIIADTKKEYDATNAKFPYNEFNGWNTKGSGLKYYYLTKLIDEARLPYKIEYNYDGGGLSSWFEIYIRWD